MKLIQINKKTVFLISLLALFVLGNQNLHAQFWKKKKKEIKTIKKTPPKKKVKSIKDLTKSSKKIEGLFTVFQDTVTGSVSLLIKENQLDKEFIYFSQIADGVADAGKIRGSYQGSSIFYVKKYFNRLEFVAPNTSFYFDKKMRSLGLRWPILVMQSLQQVKYWLQTLKQVNI